MNVRQVKKLRNVLESPFQLLWEDKNVEELLPIQHALKELLPAARIEESISKPHVKNKNESEKQSKKRMRTENINFPRNFLAPGYQSVMRGFEKKDLCCVVFASDIKPILLLKVALACAHANNIPVIVIPDLKAITNSAFGFSSMALGIKAVVAESSSNPFYKIFELISENPTKIQSPLTTKLQDNVSSVSEIDIECKNPESPKKVCQENNQSVYLYRNKNGKRAFVPSCDTEMGHGSSAKKQKQTNDFISLEGSTPSSNDSKDQSVTGKTDTYDIDDSDSDEGVFFFDNKPDKSLLKEDLTETSKSGFQKVKPKKKSAKLNKNMQALKIGISQFLNTSEEINTDTLRKMKKAQKKKNKKKLKIEKNSANTVNFQPLRVKTVTSNADKTKTKKKKKTFKVNKSN